MDELAFLEALLSIPSPSGQEDAIAGHLVQQMTSLGFAAFRDEAGNVLGTIGDPHAQKEIVLLGHMDTVPGQIPVRQEGERLYGRGAVDAKGPLAAFVLAAARVAPRLSGSRLCVVATVEEEAHGRGARHLAQTQESPYCAIIGEPSDWQGVTLGYKGVLSVEYQLVQPGGHSAGQHAGPAEKAVAFWNTLVDYSAAHNNGGSSRFHALDPSLLDFQTFGDGLQEGVTMSVSTRIPPGVEVSQLKSLLNTWCNGARVTYHSSDPPYQAEKNTSLVRAMLAAIRAQGGHPRFKLKTGTSDMNVVGPAWGCPMVAYGPGDSTLDHTPEEHIIVQEFYRSVDVLVHALETLATGP